MSVFDLEKFVREVCRIVHRMTAMATSAAAAKTFMQMDSPWPHDEHEYLPFLTVLRDTYTKLGEITECVQPKSGAERQPEG